MSVYDIELLFSEKIDYVACEAGDLGKNVAGVPVKRAAHRVLEKLREDNWGKVARVIMLTVLENTDSVARAMEKGSYEYIIKTSHSLDDVVKKVEEALKRK